MRAKYPALLKAIKAHKQKNPDAFPITSKEIRDEIWHIKYSSVRAMVHKLVASGHMVRVGYQKSNEQGRPPSLFDVPEVDNG